MDDVSAGMQFPPHVDQDDMLKIYNQRIVKVNTYTHADSETIGGQDLTIDQFTGINFGDDVGFAFNLPVFEKSNHCFDCAQDETELRAI